MSTSTDALTVVRAHFDEVLADHIRKIVDLDALPSGLTLDIATIASLVLIAEREEEIRQFSDSPPERYTRTSFMIDIRDIGLGSDAGMASGLDPLLASSLVTENAQGELKAEITAQKMLQVVNTLFPGMQGMNLVAYMVQTIDEVVSGRKDIYDAKRFFLQTLNMHSLAGQVSELSREREDSSKKGTFVTKTRKNVSPEWHRSVLQKLGRMRSERGAFRSEDMQVREIFGGGEPSAEPEIPKSPSQAEPFEPEIAKSPSQVEPFEPEIPKSPSQVEPFEPEIPRSPSQAEPFEPEIPRSPSQAEPFEPEIPKSPSQVGPFEPEVPKEPFTPPRTPEVSDPALAPASPRPVPEDIPQAEVKTAPPIPQREEDEAEEDEGDEEESAAGDADIEARIAAFEEALALTCPLCKTGKLQVNQTEKGKVFYDCSQSTCHFISWSQPFHYPCPTCGNPFLVAFMTKEGAEGLKCPRATCDYSQDARINPEEYQRKKKKKRKIVRRVKRKA
ncbi:hypothetical protein [Desulfobotulus sp.]|uniref:hypothetical protein n=1 Tax=Desulfobotulus sp. TaxID=1940337 RepID=UPI002A35C538|nr:hypothetical protein [Desulfobotulus sp.]MDY0161650.1 hypothetical protein [Desulfobotulus sp.]